MLIPISITMLVKNAETYLEQSLRALQDFDEIIVLDNGSTDNSLSIAKQFPNVNIHEHPFIGFGPMKNLAASYARHDWIINVDSDEIFTPALIEEIKKIDLNDTHKIYAISRLNHYRGKPIKTCSWYPDIVKRMYNKTKIGFNHKQVHESLELTAQQELITLNNIFLHYSYDSASELIHKMQHYTDLFVEQQHYKQHTSIGSAIGHGLAAFFKNYIIKKGVLSGADGFVISFSNAIGSYYKYVKLAEANQALAISLLIVANNEKNLPIVLDSVIQQKVLPREIIIVGDLPHDSINQLVQTYAPQLSLPIHYKPCPHHHRATLNNEAIRAAKNDYLIIIDDLTILTPYFISDHIAMAQKNKVFWGVCHELSTSVCQRLLHQGAHAKAIKGRYRLPFFKQSLTKACACVPPLSTAHYIAFFKDEAIAEQDMTRNSTGWSNTDSDIIAPRFSVAQNIVELRYIALAYCLPQSAIQDKPVPSLSQHNKGEEVSTVIHKDDH